MPAARPSLFPLLTTLAAMALLGCAAPSPSAADAAPARRLAELLPADALLLGEQHDAADHQRIERQTVELLAGRSQLAALAIEMAEQGNDTGYLAASASETQVRAALEWDDKGWPWSTYGPVVMAAVQAGVPVLGANLPRERMRNAMADVSLDAQLSAAGRAAQQEAVRSGHCNLLPEAQIVPMTRIQIARDRAMAQTIVQARVPGKTVLLVSGAGHGNKAVGVPQLLPTDMVVKVVQLQAGPGGGGTDSFDAVWHTPALPEKDYCATLRRSP
jgi:uncharacterized iron-regulated protein